MPAAAGDWALAAIAARILLMLDRRTAIFDMRDDQDEPGKPANGKSAELSELKGETT
jgi:hypothetical protein